MEVVLRVDGCWSNVSILVTSQVAALTVPYWTWSISVRAALQQQCSHAAGEWVQSEFRASWLLWVNAMVRKEGMTRESIWCSQTLGTPGTPMPKNIFWMFQKNSEKNSECSQWMWLQAIKFSDPNSKHILRNKNVKSSMNSVKKRQKQHWHYLDLDFFFLFLNVHFESGSEIFRACSHIHCEHSQFFSNFLEHSKYIF